MQRKKQEWSQSLSTARKVHYAWCNNTLGKGDHLRVVSGDGEIFKAPISEIRIPGAFTGEKLCDQLMTKISNIKNVLNNATHKIEDAIKASRWYTTAKPEQKLKKLHLTLQRSCWECWIWGTFGSERPLEEHPELKLLHVNTIQCDKESLQDEDTILTAFSPIFKKAKFDGIENDTISLF